MRLAQEEPRRPAETIVALIDVIFFLLVFFMLVGRMDATAPFEVLPPVAAIGEPMPKGGTTVSVSADGRIALDGSETTPEGLAAALEGRAEGLIRVNAHAGTELRRLLPLVAELDALGAGTVVLVVTPAVP